MMTGYRWLWVGWFGIFLVLEISALVRRRTDQTLSGFVWDLCDVTPGKTSWNWTIVHFCVFAFLLWLLLHLAFGWLWRL